MKLMKKYLLLLLAPVALMVSCEVGDNPTPSGSYAFIIKQENIRAGSTSAVIDGVYSADPTKPDNAVQVGIRYAKTGVAGEKDTAAAELSDRFTVVLEGLTPETAYTIRAYVKTSDGFTYLSDFTREFTTTAEGAVSDAAVYVAGVSGVTDTKAIFRGGYQATDFSAPVTAAGFKYRKDGVSEWTEVAADGVLSPFLYDCSGLTPETKYYVVAWVTAGGETYVSDPEDEYGFTTDKAGSGGDLLVEVDMFGVDAVTKTGAVLSATYVVRNSSETVSAVGFKYRKDGDQAWTPVTASGTSEAFSYTLSGLSAGTLYYVTAWIKLGGTTHDSPAETAESFTTLSDGTGPGPVPSKFAWPELPVYEDDSSLYYVTHYVSSNGQSDASASTAGRVRNYSICYDPEKLQSLWVAFPMHPFYNGSNGRGKSWKYNPMIPSSLQPDLGSSYAGGYSRGHQIASGDRQKSAAMNNQTFIFTNSTPQIQNEFNGGIWNDLENKIQAIGFNWADTLYVITGPVFAREEGYATDNNSKKVKVASHFYKVILSTKTDNTKKKVGELPASQLRAVGFYLDQFAYGTKDKISSTHMKSVAEVERLTGMKFFPMLSEEGAKVKESFNKNDWAGF